VVYSVGVVVGLLNILFMCCVKRKFLFFVAVKGENDCDIVKVPQCKWQLLVLNCMQQEIVDLMFM